MRSNWRRRPPRRRRPNRPTLRTLALRHFSAGAPCFAQADCNCLLSARNFLARAARFELAVLHFAHRTADFAACGPTVLSTGLFARTRALLFARAGPLSARGALPARRRLASCARRLLARRALPARTRFLPSGHRSLLLS